MTKRKLVSSRLGGFYRQSVAERVTALASQGVLSAASLAFIEAGGGLDVQLADRMTENVFATFGLPMSIAANFRINEVDRLLPMAVEEPSIVAAASNAARMIRATGGFYGEADAAVMTGQIQLDRVPDLQRAMELLVTHKDALLAHGDSAVGRLVSRGGGCRDLDARVLDVESGMLVVHVYVDVGQAMGANLVDSVAEALAPRILDLIGGRMGLRILSNLPLRRMVRVFARVGAEELGGLDLADAIARASLFAERDVFRAVTHNKGVLNAIDAVAVALGQDWRAIEAGAHAFASLKGGYQPIAVWKRDGDGLIGTLEMPLAAATVGGSTRAHPAVVAAFELLQIEDARELAVAMASAGLACNLAALRALAGEGIQQGHMRLHRRKSDVPEAQSL